MSEPARDRFPIDASARSPTVGGRLESWAARAMVFALYASLTLVVALARGVRRILRLRGPEGESARRLLVTGTFYNEGWFRSHILPLSLCRGLSEVIVVADEPLFSVDKVRYDCPPARLRRLVGRGLARAFWISRVAFRDRPGVLMGYHIMPNALLCLGVAAMTGARAGYQMTGGPIQIIGGGVGSENTLLRRLGKASRLREALLYHLVRQFSFVVVRGFRAEAFLNEHHLARTCLTIPGSVDCDRFSPWEGAKAYDLIGVGRLVAVKRWERFLAAVAQLRPLRPTVRAAIVGDGPLMDSLAGQTRALGVVSNLELLGQQDDVPGFLRQGKVWLLTSENEGLSIAMIEAMAAGLPVLAPDIGDLGEMLVDGETGLFVDAEDALSVAVAVSALLADPARLALMSRRARARAVEASSIPAVARKWEAYFSPPEASLEVSFGPLEGPAEEPR